MRTVTLHDTLSGAIRPLEPARPGRVRIYTCGPTVYGRVHVGNARHFIVFSWLARFLRHEGYEVQLVSNITDINDKIYAAAASAGMRSDDLAEQMTAHYVADTDRLGLGRPDAEPLASESVGGIIALIERLIDTGHAYVAEGDVYFSVRSDESYGELSHRQLDQLDQGEGGEGLHLKRDPVDFALWKARKPGEDTSWASPWGPGRPGWHIECSAMAEEALGVDFEIHGGGSDLVFPHHENELAQTRGATGQPLARLWVHVGMIRMDAEKMSKSIGNTFGLAEALERHGPETLLMYFAQGHWRQPMEYDETRIAEAAAFCDRIREAGRRLSSGESPPWSPPLRGRFFDALAADFSTPQALAVIADWIRQANGEAAGTVGRADLAEMLDILALRGLLEAEQFDVPAQALALVAAREQARGARDWAEADRLRDELRAFGFEVRDGPSGPELRPL
ncbi:MAG TPA: cysteine--tRNA ligase [Solirubrobacteraceae bacterium]|nr:cysteine--tRNA ligase [Solirubrobacteraceae bacterium]HTX46438.1 cysteine--tRNA ligase [Solirubrobacteraceae bacterium]